MDWTAAITERKYFRNEVRAQPAIMAWYFCLAALISKPIDVIADITPSTRYSQAEASAQCASSVVASECAHTGIRDFGQFVSMEDLLFETASAELTLAAQDSLDKLTNYLAEHPSQAVLLEGHTDSVGSDELNFELSKRRACAAQTYLIARGIEPSRLHTEGVGKSDPVAGNGKAAGRRENRSVAVIFEEQHRAAAFPNRAVP